MVDLEEGGDVPRSPLNHLRGQRPLLPELVVVGVDGAVAGDVDGKFIALEHGIEGSILNAVDDVVKARGVVDVGEGDVECVKKGVGVHPAVVNDFGDFVIFEKEFEPDYDGVRGVLVQYVEEEALVRGGNLDEGDTAIAAKVDALDVDGDGGEVVEGGEEGGGGVVPVADDGGHGGHWGWNKLRLVRVFYYFYHGFSHWNRIILREWWTCLEESLTWNFSKYASDF